MAVILAPADTTLSTVGGFRRVEEYRLGANGTTLSLSSVRTIAMTALLNSGNAQGVVLGIVGGSGYSIQVELKLLGITIASKTLSATDLKTESGYIDFVPFIFTTPVAVTNLDVLSLVVTSSGSGTQPSLLTTDGTVNNVTRAFWCDNVVSYASGDVIICGSGDIGTVTVDQSFTTTGILSTGDTTRGITGIACRAVDSTTGNGACLIWGTGGSYTWTNKGIFWVSSHGGIRAGTSGTPITITNKGKIRIEDSPVGTATLRGIAHSGSNIASTILAGGKLWLYGQTPTHRFTRLASNATSGTASITVIDDVGAGAVRPWAAGDVILIGRRLTRTTTYTTYVISGTPTTTVNLTTNLLDNYAGPAHAHSIDLKGGRVWNLTAMSESGFEIENGTSTTFPSAIYMFALEQDVNGVVFDKCGIFTRLGAAGGQHSGSSVYAAPCYLDNNYLIEDASPTQNTALYNAPTQNISKWGFRANDNFVGRGCVAVNTAQTPGFPIEYKRNYRCYTSSIIEGLFGTIAPYYIEDNEFDNCYTTDSDFSQSGGSFKGNAFWYGGGTGTYIWRWLAVLGLDDTLNNYWINLVLPIQFNGQAVNSIFKSQQFVSAGANDIATSAGFFGSNVSFLNPTGSPTVVETNRNSWQPNSMLAMNGYNADATDVRIYKTEGVIRSTGYGLADTFVLKADNTWGTAAVGEYSLKFSPDKAGFDLIYEDNNGSTTIGNNQNEDVQALVKLLIKNAAFYSGTHTKPTLTTTFDGSTTATAVATGAITGQTIQTTFSPTTTTSKVNLKLTMQTDATGTDRDVYVGSVVAKPAAGVVIDTQRLDAFNDYGLPLGTTRTFPTSASPWESLISSSWPTGSFGHIFRRIYYLILAILNKV